MGSRPGTDRSVEFQGPISSVGRSRWLDAGGHSIDYSGQPRDSTCRTDYPLCRESSMPGRCCAGPSRPAAFASVRSWRCRRCSTTSGSHPRRCSRSSIWTSRRSTTRSDGCRIGAVAQLLDRCVEATSCRPFRPAGRQPRRPAPVARRGRLPRIERADIGTALEIIRRVKSVADGGGVVTSTARKHRIPRIRHVEPGLRHTEQPRRGGDRHRLQHPARGAPRPAMAATDVQFSFAAPRAVAPYRKVFGVTPRFDQERSAIAFPTAGWQTHRRARTRSCIA